MSPEQNLLNKRFNIILDLDQTIIAGEVSSDIKTIRNVIDRQTLEYKLDDYGKKYGRHEFATPDGESYTIYGRPYLQEFLDVLFTNFNVSVWTAASHDYAQFVINNFILIPGTDRKLDVVYTRSRCELFNDPNGSQFLTKPLVRLFSTHSKFNKNNTLILDDNEDVRKIQPNNCVLAVPFEIVNKKRNSSGDVQYIKVKNTYFNTEGDKDDFLAIIASQLWEINKNLTQN